ncbi:MAG: cation:proton antiporter [Bradymonadaceae bacterium]|nr:cation:proton antiporter [Lujinxingiaceae bacterium]
MHASHFQIPITDPVLTFALVMLMILVAPMLVGKLKLPGIIGLLIAGAVVGPNAIGLLERDQTFRLLGTVGLLYIMFTAGLEIDLNRFLKYKNHSIVFGIITFIIPQSVGTAVAYYILGFDFMVAVLLASMFASHTLLGYPVISKLGLSKASSVTTAVGGTIITDTAALLVLAVVMGATRGELDAAFWIRLGTGLSIYTFLLFWGLPKVGRWFFRIVGSEGVREYVFVLAAVFLAAFLSEVAGVEAIIGAFLAGLALNRLIPESSTLMNRIEFVGNALFIPFFLISVGMLVDVRVLFAGTEALIVAAAMVLTALSTKWLAAMITQRILNYSPEEGMVIYSLSVAQAAATLAVVLVAYDVGLFNEAVLNGTIVMIAVTCFVAPMVAEKYGRRLAIKEEQARGDAPVEAPQRILIPMAYAATARSLLDFTFILREHGSEEPVYPLAVVPDDEETTLRVANAEKMLSNSVIHGASAEVPVVPVTRVAHNPATGIARAIIERRISDVVVGWQGPESQQKGTFGRITDQLLDESEQQIFICRLKQPINTTQRVVVVFPPHIEHHPGFILAVRAIKRITNALGALCTGLCLQDDMRRMRSRFDAIKPEVTSTFVGFLNFEDLLKTLSKRIEANDLVIFLAARKGTVAWSAELERLPSKVSELGDQNMVFLFPAQMESSPMLTPLPSSVSTQDLFRPERIALNIPATDYEEAVSYMLATRFESDERRLKEVTAAVVSEQTGFTTEASQGVILAHARTPHVLKTLVFVATSEKGLSLREHAEHPIHLVFLLLSPEDVSLQDHLQRFAELGQIVSHITDARALASNHVKSEIIEVLKDLARDNGDVEEPGAQGPTPGSGNAHNANKPGIDKTAVS